MTADTYSTCSICKDIPQYHYENFLDGGQEVPIIYKPLNGWEGINLSAGYQASEVSCPECATKYLVEIDVEPFVWDFSVTRLVDGMKDYKGYYQS